MTKVRIQSDGFNVYIWVGGIYVREIQLLSLGFKINVDTYRLLNEIVCDT